MEQYLTTGRFPPNPIEGTDSDGLTTKGTQEGFVETEVRTRFWWEFVQIFVVLGIFGLLGNALFKAWTNFTSGNL